MNLLSEKYSKHMEVLGNTERVKILEMLMEKEMCVLDITTKMIASQATISYHLAMLKEVGFVNSIKDGKYMRYSADIHNIKIYLKGFVQDFSFSLKKCPISNV